MKRKPDPLEPGTFVQVKEGALQEGTGYYKINVDLVTEHGWLWFVAEEEDYATEDDRLYWCRSLATGDIGSFFHTELNVHQEEGAD